jgi:hypothetical protein
MEVNMRSMTVTPAYGRDYKSAAAAVAAWDEGKDFVDSQSGRYVGKSDAPAGVEVRIRYLRLTRVVVVVVPR